MNEAFQLKEVIAKKITEKKPIYLSVIKTATLTLVMKLEDIFYFRT